VSLLYAQRAFESEPQKDSHLLEESLPRRRRPIRRAPDDEQVKGAEPNLLTGILSQGSERSIMSTARADRRDH